MKKIFLLLLLVSLLVGCTHRVGDFTIISTKNFAASKDVRFKKIGRFKGKHMSFVKTHNIKDAIDNCIQKGNGDFLMNCVIDYYEGFFEEGYIVRGDVYKMVPVKK